MLEQMVTSPTWGQNILDLFFTTNPTLVNKVSILPGLSDHDIVLVEVNSRPEIIKQVPRDIPLYKKANWDQLKQSMRDLYTEFQSEPATTDSQAIGDKFTSRFQQGIDKYIPTRSSGTKDSFPWSGVGEWAVRVIQGMYTDVKSGVHVNGQYSKKFGFELVCIRDLFSAPCFSYLCWKLCRASSVLVCHGSFCMLTTLL